METETEGEDRLKDLEERLDRLEAEIKDQELRLDALVGLFHYLEERLDQAVDRLGRERDELRTRVRKLELS